MAPPSAALALVALALSCGGNRSTTGLEAPPIPKVMVSAQGDLRSSRGMLRDSVATERLCRTGGGEDDPTIADSAGHVELRAELEEAHRVGATHGSSSIRPAGARLSRSRARPDGALHLRLHL